MRLDTRLDTRINAVGSALMGRGWRLTGNPYRSDAGNNAVYAGKGKAKPYKGQSRHSTWQAIDIWHDDPQERATMVAQIKRIPGLYAEDEGDHVHVEVD